MDTYKNDKAKRILSLYTQLINGRLINKFQAAADFGVDERSIQRDIDDIRNFLEANADSSGFITPLFTTEMKKAIVLNIFTK